MLLRLAHLQELLRVHHLLLRVHLLEAGDQPRKLALVRLHRRGLGSGLLEGEKLVLIYKLTLRLERLLLIQDPLEDGGQSRVLVHALVHELKLLFRAHLAQHRS